MKLGIHFLLFLLSFSVAINGQEVVFDSLPQSNQLYQRDMATNAVDISVVGHVKQTTGYERLKLELNNEQGLISEAEKALDYATDKAEFNFQVRIPAQRNNHEIKISGLKNSTWETVIIVPKILAGDIYIINGQSNAQAAAAPDLGDVDEYTRSWFPLFGWGTLNLSYPGLWGARLAKQISVSENIPIAIFNQAVGAEPIKAYLPEVIDGNYHSLLARFDNAGLDYRARAGFWFHGEANSYGTSIEEYISDFEKIKTAWESDFKIERTFVFQMRYESCSSESALIMEAHRRMKKELLRTDIMSSTNAYHDGCHFFYEGGYKELGDRMTELVKNQLYNGTNDLASPPNIEYIQVSPSDNRILEIQFEEDTPLRLVGEFPLADFKVENSSANVIAGQITQNTIRIELDADFQSNSGLSYLGHAGDTLGLAADPTVSNNTNWITNDAGVGILTFYNFPIGDNTNVGPDLTCYADYSVNSLEVTVSDFKAAISTIKILKEDFSVVFSCDNFSVQCNDTEVITLPEPGAYFIQIQTYRDFSTGICDIFESFDASAPTDPCQNDGGDADGDGFCANQDCNDNDSNISQPRDTCDDGNPNTINDNIQSDCSCLGTIVSPCFNSGGDADADGICADMDCNDNDPNISQPGDTCDDGDDDTINDIVQDDCSCAGIPVSPCFHNGGDIDADGICANQDCDDNDPNIGLPGEICDDGNPNTENDILQTDCTCLGTLIPPCQNEGGDADGDGFCADFDCDDNNPNVSQPGDTCDDNDADTENDIILSNCSCAGTPIDTSSACIVSISLTGNTLSVKDFIAPISLVKVMDSNFDLKFSCNSWETPCPDSIQFTFDEPGTYFLQIETLSDWTAPPICRIFETLTVSQIIPNCENITDGGLINGDEIICSGDLPAPIFSPSLPSGGTGRIEYRWLSSTIGCPNDLSQTIPGARQSIYYFTEPLTETTYFRRLSKRTDCLDWFAGESNCIIKTAEDCNPIPNCRTTFSLSGNELSVSGLNYPIASVLIRDEATGSDVYLCNNWTTPCDSSETILLATGTYFLNIQTFETWEQPRCEILEIIEITDNNQTIPNNPNFSRRDAPLSSISVFPNPANNTLNISIPGSSKKDIEIRLIDSFGKTQQVLPFGNTDQLLSINIEDQASGIYTVWIFPEGEKPICKRVFIEK